MVVISKMISDQFVPRCLLASTLLVSIAGCAGLEMANAVLQTGNTAVSDLVPAERITEVSNDLESATAATYKPYHYRSGQQCISSAFVVPYARTWPEETSPNDSGVVQTRPPEPDKIAGYIAVVYEKKCPSAPPEPILRAGRQPTITGKGTIFTRAFSTDNTTYFMSTWDSAVDSRDMTEPGAKPVWWPQVVERLTRLSKTDSAIKQMLVANESLFLKAAPEQAEAVQAALR
ncbi:hypothetical protein LMG26684_03904 [Achromobacter mucicolens]|uniref:hypothetical protein n=1 Tax=Achromobacter mucicolens TaxID=1389922 RepID=UPI00146919BA|nr:hypothetical protein [Achromobacter mucicolens]CAB3887326.1 hypothetical protein LMG26684_03904 [Achromobacter mucicolens]